MKPYKVAIVDDELLARDIMRNYLSSRTDIEIVGECENGYDCIKLINTTKVDILFLDIQMPKIDGFEMLEILNPRPEIIFCTAFDSFALKAFEMNAIDYLLKPFSKERLYQATDKAIERIENGLSVQHDDNLNQLQKMRDDNIESIERIVVRNGSKLVIIPVNDIIFLEAADDYVMIYTKDSRYMKDKTMKYFETHLPKKQFIRTHRSFIANIQQIKSIEAYSKDSHIALMINNEKIKISAEGYKKLKEMF